MTSAESAVGSREADSGPFLLHAAMRTPLLLVALALAACGSPDPDDVTPDADDLADEISRDVERETSGLDFDLGDLAVSSDLAGRPVDAVFTRDGNIELGVTDSVLYSRLSAELQREIETEMKEETADQTGLGGTIARAVTGAVAEGLAMAVSVPLSDIRDVRYEDGRVVIEMETGGPSPFDRSQNDDEPMLEQFDAEAGRRLADAFDKAASR